MCTACGDTGYVRQWIRYGAGTDGTCQWRDYEVMARCHCQLRFDPIPQPPICWPVKMVED